MVESNRPPSPALTLQVCSRSTSEASSSAVRNTAAIHVLETCSCRTASLLSIRRLRLHRCCRPLHLLIREVPPPQAGVAWNMFRHFDASTMAALGCSCKHFAEILSDDGEWKDWLVR